MMSTAPLDTRSRFLIGAGRWKALPGATCVLLSVVLTLVLNLFKKP